MCNKCYDDGQHEFVGMDMCIYCGECKQLLLQPNFFRGADGQMHPKKGIQRQQCTSPEPCDKCKEKFKKDGVVPLYEATPDEITGQPIFGKRYLFIKREAVKGPEFIKFMDEHGFLLCDAETIDALIKKQN